MRKVIFYIYAIIFIYAPLAALIPFGFIFFMWGSVQFFLFVVICFGTVIVAQALKSRVANFLGVEDEDFT